MAHSINIGDVVQLRCGGPRMVVEAIKDRQGVAMATCAWFTRDTRSFGPMPATRRELMREDIATTSLMHATVPRGN